MLARSRHVQVALTYTRPLMFRVWLGLVALFGLLGALGLVNSTTRLRSVAGLFVSLVLYGTLAATVAAHAKEQLADARARLTPGFRGPHLLIAALALAAGLALFTAPIAFVVGHLPMREPLFSTPAVVAFLLFVGAIMAWMAHLQSPLFIALWIAGWLTFGFPRVQEWTMEVLAGDAPNVVTFTIVISAVALLALGRRLASMHEEMPEYFRQSAVAWKLRAAMTGDVALRRQAASDTAAVDDLLRGAAFFDRPPNVAAATFWQRVRHWRRALGLGRTPWIIAALIALWMYVLPRLMPEGSKPRDNEVIGVLAMMLPIVLATHAWPRRWYLLGYESLFPIPRRRFLAEQFTAMGLDLAIAWLAMMLAVIGVSVLSYPRQLLQEDLWAILLMLFCWQVPLFAINLWVLRVRSGWLSFVTMIGSAIAELMPFAVVGMRPSSMLPDWSLPLIALVFAGAGAALIAVTFQQWLRTDLD